MKNFLTRLFNPSYCPANNGGKCPECGSKNIESDNLNWWCLDCLKN